MHKVDVPMHLLKTLSVCIPKSRTIKWNGVLNALLCGLYTNEEWSKSADQFPTLYFAQCWYYLSTELINRGKQTVYTRSHESKKFYLDRQRLCAVEKISRIASYCNTKKRENLFNLLEGTYIRIRYQKNLTEQNLDWNLGRCKRKAVLLLEKSFHAFQKFCLCLRSAGTWNWKINYKIVESVYIGLHDRE